MEKKIHVVLALIFALCITTGVSAQDAPEKSEKAKVQKQNRKRNKGKKQKERLAQRIMKSASSVELTEDQKTKLAALIDEKFETIQATQKKIDGFIGKDDRKTLNAAVKKARGEGKAWREAMTIAYEEIGLSEEDQKSVKALNEERNGLFDTMQKEIVATFSEDQKKTLKEARAKNRKGKGKGKKGKGDKDKSSKQTSKN